MKKLVVIGFNARPIAKAAKKAGYRVGAVDYFGDLDLLLETKNCFSVLRQRQGELLHRPLHRSPAEYLYLLTEIMAEEQGDFDGILVGSAFDRFPELIDKFNKIGPMVYANTVEKFALARNRVKVNALAEKVGFRIPGSKQVESPEELLEYSKNLEMPIVTRGSGGGGGAGIKRWDNSLSLEESLKEKEWQNGQRVLVQEYIDGIDCSASVICSKDSVHIISLNQQLIGERLLHSPGDFSYCGNIVPLPKNQSMLSEEREQAICDMVRELFLKLELQGSNGIDFVLRDGVPYFMEINPRFQGSIEAVQYATGYNLVDLHIRAFDDSLPEIPQYPTYKKSACKGILFVEEDTQITVKRYPKSRWIVDRTHFGVVLEGKDPFCTIVRPIKKEGDIEKMYKLAQKIYQQNQKL